MKYFYITHILLLLTIPAFSQDRPGFLSDIDRTQQSGGSQTAQRHSPAISGRAAARSVPNPYFPSPPVFENIAPATTEDKPLRKIVKVTLTVTDGEEAAKAPTNAKTSFVVIAPGNGLARFSTGDDSIDQMIVDSCRKYNVDPLLVYAQMGQESSYNPRAISHKGARGLMQLMPATARRLGVTDIYDPRQNIDGGVKYMRILLDLFSGDMELALAGYNAGEGAVLRYGYQIPPYAETKEYVRRISMRYRSLRNSVVARAGQAKPKL